MLLWGTLPLALKGLLVQLDAGTITWARFVASALALAAFLAVRDGLPALARTDRAQWTLLGVATVFLAANYLGYIVGLDRSTAADAQVLIQLAPLLLSLGGLVLFREHFTPLQWLGFGVLVAGLGVFFAGQLAVLVGDVARYRSAVGIMLAAALAWAVYGLAQKQLLHTWPSARVMLWIYVGCALLFSPLASPRALLGLDAVGILLLVYCAANTAVAYGAFAESLAHWEASRVSAVLALTPLVTLACAELVESWWPAFQDAPPLPLASVLGALLVVLGSLATALGSRQAWSDR
jgi:drug/metabolite transporter (DMT)-like permease